MGRADVRLRREREVGATGPSRTLAAPGGKRAPRRLDRRGGSASEPPARIVAGSDRASMMTHAARPERLFSLVRERGARSRPRQRLLRKVFVEWFSPAALVELFEV